MGDVLSALTAAVTRVFDVLVRSFGPHRTAGLVALSLLTGAALTLLYRALADEARIRQAFMNMKRIAESEGASLSECVRLTVFVTDMNRLRPLVNKVQEELWTGGPYPPRTIVEVAKLNQDDFFEVEGTFYSPKSQ